MAILIVLCHKQESASTNRGEGFFVQVAMRTCCLPEIINDTQVEEERERGRPGIILLVLVDFLIAGN